ncbi:unnamed protein product [Miscanthus lutarioriparius]|uniref:Uncharacterized protein n=1 Tax=Miscanthus lutarioriparius TaxID=422564 RepID=A0A811N3L6_9POAL|nr:unnamed protein product [Miscanthus lutarioriparius]
MEKAAVAQAPDAEAASAAARALDAEAASTARAPDAEVAAMFHHLVLATSRNHHEGENSRRERDHLDHLHNILACDHEASGGKLRFAMYFLFGYSTGGAIVLEGIDDKVITVVFLKGGTEFTAIVVDVGTANNSDLVLLPTKLTN